MKRLDLLFYGIFLVIICLLAWKIVELNGKIKSQKENVYNPYLVQYKYIGKEIKGFNLPLVNKQEMFEFTPNQSNLYYLFIFFTPWDCHECFQEIPFWKELENIFYGRLKVIAIGTADSLNLLNNFVEGKKISVLTLYDEKERFFI